MKRSKNPETNIHPETSYLIDDVQELVNQHERSYLWDAVVDCEVHGFSPYYESESIETMDTSPLPIGITLLTSQAERFIPSLGEFVDMHVRFPFPMQSPHQVGFGVTLHYSDGSECIVEYTKDGPKYMFGTATEVLSVKTIDVKDAHMYLSSLGLPASIHSQTGTFENLLHELHNSTKVTFERRYRDRIDPHTSIDIVHSALYASDLDDKKVLVQELTIDIDDLEHSHPHNFIHAHSRPVKRKTLRFDRSDEDDKNGWRYRGTYDVTLEPCGFGERPKIAQQKLIVPKSGLLDRVLGFFQPTLE